MPTPTREQDYRYLVAFEAGPLDGEQRRVARDEAGISPTGGWYDRTGHGGCLYHVDDERDGLTQGGRGWIAYCRHYKFDQGVPIPAGDDALWLEFWTIFQAGYEAGLTDGQRRASSS